MTRRGRAVSAKGQGIAGVSGVSCWHMQVPSQAPLPLPAAKRRVGTGAGIGNGFGLKLGLSLTGLVGARVAVLRGLRRGWRRLFRRDDLRVHVQLHPLTLLAANRVGRAQRDHATDSHHVTATLPSKR